MNVHCCTPSWMTIQRKFFRSPSHPCPRRRGTGSLFDSSNHTLEDGDKQVHVVSTGNQDQSLLNTRTFQFIHAVRDRKAIYANLQWLFISSRAFGIALVDVRPCKQCLPVYIQLQTTVTVCGPLSNIGRLAKQRHQACPRVRVSLFHCTSAHSLARVTIRCVEHNWDFLHPHSSALEFRFQCSEYFRLLTPSPSKQSRAIDYTNKHLQPFFASHPAVLKRLMGCLIFLPMERMQKSPYEDFTSDSIHCELENIFVTEFSASLGVSKRLPLRIVSNIGGGGALAKIEEGRKLMWERKSELKKMLTSS